MALPRDPAERRRNALTALLVAQLVLAGLFLTSVLAGGADAPSSSSGASAPAASTPVSIEEGVAIAEAVARGWQQEAAFVSATMRVDWPKDGVPETTAVSPFGWIVYVYRSGAALLSVTVDRRTGAVLDQSGAEGTLPPGPSLTTYPYSSEVAVLTAELVAGNAYRARCPAQRSVTRVGLSDDGSAESRPVWVVTYGDERRPGKIEVTVKIDASTGAVIAQVVEDAGCDGEA